MALRARPCTHKSRLVGSGWSMSALPPKADIRQRIEHVCFVPATDILKTANEGPIATSKSHALLIWNSSN
jgi:hypothetical protein